MKTFNIIVSLCLIFTILGKAQDSLYLYATIHGENDQDQFGVVENVGDVNGDGYEDLIVGAPAYFPYTESNGYAKLYYGGAEFDTLADMTFRINDDKVISFGVTVTGNGDLNGDGYSDFAIADHLYGSFQVGKIFVYYGGPELDTIPDLELTLNSEEYFYTRLGVSMTMNGDINNDGYDDLVVSAPYDDYDRHGEVFIYFGATEMDDEFDINLICNKPLQLFGYTLDYIGDVNEDYFDDLLVGSYPVDNDTTAFIFWGNSLPNIGFMNSHSYTIPTDGRVASLSDINGDGYRDFAIGAKVFSNLLNNGELIEILIENPDSIKFEVKTSCGDINGDGIDEIIAQANSRPKENEEVFIIYGGDEPSFKNSLSIKDPDDKIGFGRDIASFRNFVNDTTVSIIIGDKETNVNFSNGTGKVLIYTTENLVEVGLFTKYPQGYTLNQNYPNPFNPNTNISYRIPIKSNVTLKLYNSLGEEISTLVSQVELKGTYTIQINTLSYSLSSGIYFVKMKAVPIGSKKEVYNKTIKIVLTK